MRPHLVEEVVYSVPYRVSQIEFLAVRNQASVLNHVVKLLVHILYEVLSCSFQEKDLVVVITVVRQVTALLAHKLVVNYTKCNEWLQMVLALRI